MDAGTVRAVIRIPQGFSADLRAGKPVALQLIVDGTLSNDSAITLNYASQAIGKFNSRKATEGAATSTAALETVEVRIRAWYNPNLESKYYYVPGLIAVMLILIGLVLTSMAIVREKEIGTIEQVMVTPIRRVEFIIGKTLPFLLTGMVTMTLMFIIARILFGIRIEGSVTLLYATASIYILGNLGLALLVECHGPHAAAGLVDRILNPHAHHPAERLYLPHPQYACPRSMGHGSQPNALVPANSPRHRGQGGGHQDPVAACHGPDRSGRRLPHPGRGEI